MFVPGHYFPTYVEGERRRIFLTLIGVLEVLSAYIQASYTITSTLNANRNLERRGRFEKCMILLDYNII